MKYTLKAVGRHMEDCGPDWWVLFDEQNNPWRQFLTKISAIRYCERNGLEIENNSCA